MAVRSGLGGTLPVEQFDQLSPNHQRLARYVSENPSILAFASASEIGRQVEMSTATVVRFAQALGFSGYPEFQETVRRAYLQTLQPLEALENHIAPHQDFFELQLYRDLDNLRRTMHALHLDRDLLTELANRVDQAQEIVIAANRGDSALAILLGHHLRSMGYRAIAEVRGGQHLREAIAPLQPKDLLIGIEFGHEDKDLSDALSWATAREVSTASFTDLVYAPVARVAELSIVLPTEAVSPFRSLVAPLSIVQGLLAYLEGTADSARQRRFKEALQSMELQQRGG